MFFLFFLIPLLVVAIVRPMIFVYMVLGIAAMAAWFAI